MFVCVHVKQQQSQLSNRAAPWCKWRSSGWRGRSREEEECRQSVMMDLLLMLGESVLKPPAPDQLALFLFSALHHSFLICLFFFLSFYLCILSVFVAFPHTCSSLLLTPFFFKLLWNLLSSLSLNTVSAYPTYLEIALWEDDPFVYVTPTPPSLPVTICLVVRPFASANLTVIICSLI